MLRKIFLIALLSALFTGCASVPMAKPEHSDAAKQFSQPAQGKAGLYVYRDSAIGAALKKDVWVNGECLGETAPNIFFFREVDGDKDHVVSTESEFSPNLLNIHTKSGENYFIRQYIKIGAFVGGANLEIAAPEAGKAAVKSLNMAEAGKCSTPDTPHKTASQSPIKS